ncbi:polysaccharide deacetylase family protein [Aciduricibacillus chroicocephali]|uniref:Polysaccharide deacetylase family protein n=1 Tax=Aciduricibacillus chroicocephali TaxID=3054939 RepID=A0ABY9KSX3_9BACI|nr:polysaccharide deacetylase family protein [Bacillaceae bacterium 44XB]
MRKKIMIPIAMFFVFFTFVTSIQAATKSREEYEKKGDIIWETETDQKIVAITFDDGPHSLYTDQILDILKKYNAKSTFFIMGAHAQKHPDIIKRQSDEGHEIANHTYNHLYGNTDQLNKEIKRTTNIIGQITGTRSALFRPVGGLFNDTVVNTSKNNNHLVVMWSWHQDTYDWQLPGVNKIVNKVTSGIRPGDIILMHDAGGDRTQTVKALEKILKRLTKDGYEFVTVSELLYRSNSILPEFIENEFGNDAKFISE